LDNDRNQWFYFNSQTGESQWEHPLDAQFRKLVELSRKKGECLSPQKDHSNSSSAPNTSDDVKDIDDASSLIIDNPSSAEV
jgi:hypothetical protein